MSECLNCRNSVGPSFGRVYGDDSGNVHRCPECDSWRRLQRGSAAGLDPGVPDDHGDGRHGSSPAAEWTAEA